MKRIVWLLLQELQLGEPSAQLADAQQALARAYGFASWPRLKSHVELQARAHAEPQSPFVGKWTANLAKSRRHPANEFRHATIVFEVEGDNLRITDVVIDASGREERHVNTIKVDGREHAAESGNGYSLLAGWRDSHTLEAVGKKTARWSALRPAKCRRMARP